jgi:NAD(P)-dependent dehydrogenase (short-subunit alcohol dehydrogenase family)
MLALEGKVAVITGGTSGIGARTAEVFVAEGARVVIAGRRKERGERLAQMLGEAARFIRTDVSVEADVKAMIDLAVDRFGRLDCLMNNAGMPSQFVAIADVDLQQFDAVIAVHLRAVLAGMKYATRAMAPQRAGSIINVASVNGIRAGLEGHYYSAAKAASIHLTRCAAVELGEKGIRVNSISPGMTVTGAFGKCGSMTPDPAHGASVRRSAYLPIGGIGTPSGQAVGSRAKHSRPRRECEAVNRQLTMSGLVGRARQGSATGGLPDGSGKR